MNHLWQTTRNIYAYDTLKQLICNKQLWNFFWMLTPANLFTDLLSSCFPNLKLKAAQINASADKIKTPLKNYHLKRFTL